MALHLVAVPIGDPGDITLRAIEVLKSADVVIGEERKEVSKLLKRLGIEGKQLELLNEHSKDQDVRELVRLCEEKNVALVSDCGTPGFCDPGAKLVAACRVGGISCRPIPGASSLMCLLSISGHEMREFLFRGFLPADREERSLALRELDREKRPVVLMDTPYRLQRLLSELAERWPNRRAVLGCDFTQGSEDVFEGKISEIKDKVGERKAEFVLLLFPQEYVQKRPVQQPPHRALEGASTSQANRGPKEGRGKGTSKISRDNRRNKRPFRS